jgi:hypothetical protein
VHHPQNHRLPTLVSFVTRPYNSIQLTVMTKEYDKPVTESANCQASWI